MAYIFDANRNGFFELLKSDNWMGPDSTLDGVYCPNHNFSIDGLAVRLPGFQTILSNVGPFLGAEWTECSA